jgi:hypothetical protein
MDYSRPPHLFALNGTGKYHPRIRESDFPDTGNRNPNKDPNQQVTKAKVFLPEKKELDRELKSGRCLSAFGSDTGTDVQACIGAPND